MCLGASSVTAKEPGLESIGAGADNPEPAMTAGASVGAGWPLSVLLQHGLALVLVSVSVLVLVLVLVLALVLGLGRCWRRCWRCWW